MGRAYHFHDVGMFHKKFGLPEVTSCVPGPREVAPDMLEFRMKFLCEELQEFLEGVGLSFRMSLYDLVLGNAEWVAEKDHAKMFDALIDLVYVAYGTAHLEGYPWEDGWNAVQHANMAKVRATKETASERGGTNDVIKPPGWTAPDIGALLQSYGWSNF